MNNILVLINLSAGAERIAKLALKVAEQTNSNLLLCNVFQIPVAQNMALAGFDEMNWQFDENPCLVIEDLVEKLQIKQSHQLRKGNHQPEIGCINHTDFNDDKVKALVMEHHIKMIISVIPDVLDLGISGLMPMINKATCPVMLIPEHADFDSLDTTAYLTDLRYCDIEVVRYLKTFNAKIYVTHLSASGIPDMEDGYAQSLLSDAVSAKVSYNKLFLRNIKGNNRKPDLEAVTKNAGIKFFTIVNQKHNLLERFLSDKADSRRAYHNMPLLIMPYPNWSMV